MQLQLDLSKLLVMSIHVQLHIMYQFVKKVLFDSLGLACRDLLLLHVLQYMIYSNWFKHTAKFVVNELFRKIINTCTPAIELPTTFFGAGIKFIWSAAKHVNGVTWCSTFLKVILTSTLLKDTCSLQTHMYFQLFFHAAENYCLWKWLHHGCFPLCQSYAFFPFNSPFPPEDSGHDIQDEDIYSNLEDLAL